MTDEKTPVKEADEFDSAWNQANDPEEQATESSDSTLEQQTDEAPEIEAEADDANAESDEGESEDDGETGEEAGEAEDPDPQAELAKLREDIEKAKQEARTWQGRARKAREEVEKASLGTAVDAVRESQEDAGRKEATKSDLSKLTDAQREALRDVFGDDDSVLEAIRAMAREEAERIAADQVQSVAPSIEDIRREQHFWTIRAAHADFDQLIESGAVRDWVESLPYQQAVDYVRVMESGTAAEAIAMLSAYKQSLKEAPEPEPPKPDVRRERQFAASTGVKPRPGGPPRGKPDPNDFDGAWSEAIRRR